MKNHSFRLTVVIAMFVNLVGPALAPLPAAAAPAPASLGALPSWFAPASAATSEPEAALPSWFSSDNRRPAAAIEHPASGALPAWFSPPNHPHRVISSNNLAVSGPADINNCDPVTFTIVAANNNVTTTNVVITSAMPGDFTPLSSETCSYSTVTPNETITCTVTYRAGCDAVSGQNVVTLTQSGHSPIVKRTEFTVLPGAITLRKVPSVIPASVGDVVTWTVIVENTGYGRVDNVAVTDTLGTGLEFVSGALSASTASLAVGEFLTFPVSALVTECTGLDNDVEATWGCPDQTCQTHTAQASIDLQLKSPYLDYTLPNFDIDYCEGSGTFTIPVNNSGLGTAHSVVLSATNMMTFAVTALSPGATYTPGLGFSLPDIGGESDYDLVCELAAVSPCDLSPSGGNFEFELQFDDDCGNPYVLPVKQKNWSLSGDVPSLDISKEMPGEIYLGEAVTPTITVDAAHVGYSPVIVTDTLPPGWTVVDSRGGSVFTDSGATYITWTVSGNATTVLTPVIRSPIVSGTGVCDYCGGVAQNTVEVRATDCQTCTHYANDTAATQIQCEDILNSHGRQVAPAAAETCTGFVYTSTYIFASFDVTPTWAGMVFTDDLPYQTYITGSASIQLSNGSISCAAVFSETVSDGRLVITNISPTCSISVPNTTMEIVFQSAITAPGGCNDMTFYDWSHLDLGVTGNGICADDGILEEGVYVSVDAPQMALGIDGIPANVEPCAAYTITLTLTRLGDAPAKDVALRFDTVDYAIVDLLGFGGLTPYFTHTGELSRTWFYSDDFTTATTATVYLRVQRHCDATSGALAHAWYEGNCEGDDEYFEECYINSPANPPALWPSLIVAKYPELYYADDDVVTWTLTLINSGPATAREIILTDTLGAGLRYYASTITTTRGSVAGVIPDVSPDERLITWTLHEVASGAQVTIKFVAEIVSCEDLTNEFSGWQFCLDEICLPVGPKSSYVLLPDTVLINTNNALSPLYTCLTRTITATVKNAGLMSVYSATVTETLPSGMMYVTGTTRYVIGSGATPPASGWIAGGEPDGGPLGPLMWSSSQITNLAHLYPHETVWIVFDVRAGCEFEGGNITIQASYRDVCDVPQYSSASHFAMNAEPPEVTASKVGRNIDTGSDWGNPTVAEPGDTVQWRITVENDGGSDAPDTVVTDTLPSNTTFVSAVPTPTFQSGNLMVWDIGTLAAHTSQVFTVTATVNVSECAEVDTTNVVTAVWGCPDPVCRQETTTQAALRTRPLLDPTTTTGLPPATLHQCGGTLTVTLNNTGSPAYNVTLTDTLPLGFVYSGTVGYSTAPSGTLNLGQSVVFTWAVLPPGTTYVAFEIINGSGSTGCQIPFGSNLITVTYNDHNSCLNTGIYVATDSQPITISLPSLEVSKLPEQQVSDVEQMVSWTIVVSNTGSGVAYGTVITDVVASNYVSNTITATLGSDGSPPTIFTATNTIIWTPSDIQADGVWTATVSAEIASGGSNRNTVTATTYCDTGCVASTAGDVAYVTLLKDYGKGPPIQTGAIGSLTVFSIALSLSDGVALYEALTLTDTLPTGLGYVSSWLSVTFDADDTAVGVISTTPTITPGWLDSGHIIWRLGDLSGTVSVNGVITAVIQDITANVDGVRLTNVLTIAYTDDGQSYVHTDTADVDVLEPLLHIGKTYVTLEGCEALLFQDNFNDADASEWTFYPTSGHGWDATSNGLLRNAGNGSNRRAFAGDYAWTDYSYSAMVRSGDNDSIGLIFRAQNSTQYYRFVWNRQASYWRLQVLTPTVHLLASDESSAYEEDRWYHLEIRVEGDRLSGWIDGGQIFAVTDTTFASGGVGLYASSETLAQFDDILITRFGETGCTVGAGDHVTYTLTISNQARIPGYDLVITDSIPAGMSLLTYTMESDDPDSTVTAWPVPIPGATGDLIWRVDQLTATSPFDPLNHTALTLTVVLTVSDGITANTILPNQASLAYSSQPGDGPDPADVERDYSGGSHSTAVRTVNGGIVKSVQFSPPPTATLGTLVTYTLTVPASPISATLYDVVVTDTIDSRLRIEGVTTGGGAGDVSSGFVRNTGLVTAAFASIPHDTQAYVTVTARISHEWPSAAGDANDGETIANTAVMTHTTADEVAATNQVNTDVYEPDVSVTKSAASSTGSLNDLDGAAFLTYTLQLVNTGTSPAYSIYITDAIPSGISVTAQYGGDARSGPVVGADTLTWTVGYLSNVAPGNSLLLTYTARITQAASNAWLTNIADILYHSLTDTIPGVRPYTDTDSADVETAPPEIVKATEPITLKVGDIVTYHLVFTIPAGTVGMGGNSYLRDTLPPGVWYMTDTESLDWTPNTVAVTTTQRVSGTLSGSQVITWYLSQPITSEQNLPTVITLTFQAQAVGLQRDDLSQIWSPYAQIHTVTNTVGLWQRSEYIGEDDVNNEIIQPDLDIAKDSVPPSGSYVGAGDAITYTLTIANSGHGPAYDVMVRDWLPSGIEYVRTISAPNPSTAVITPIVSGQRITYTVSELAAGPGATMVITIVAQVSDTIGANLVLTNTGAIPYYDSQPGDGPGPYTPDERDYIDGTDSVFHLTVDGEVEKGVTPSAATLGDVVTYTIRAPQPPITATLYNVTVTDELNDRLMLQSVNGPSGTVATAGNAFTVTYPSIVAGEQRFITVTAVLSSPLMANAGDVITNLAVLEHQDGGPTPSEEPPFTVTEPSLTLVKDSEPATGSTVRAGDSVTYTVTIANWSSAAASPAYDVAFTDTMPVGMRDAAPTLITVTLDGAAVLYNSGYNAATGVFTLTFSSAFSIPVGGELEIQYVAIVDSDVAAARDLTNQAQVTWSSLPGDVDGDRDYGPEEDDTTVHTPPANALSKDVVPLTIAIGRQVIFSATLPDPPEGVVLHNVVFTDVVDSRLSIGGVSATGSASWGVDGQTVTVTWASIPTYTQRYVYITTTLRHMPTTTMGTQITNVAIFSHDMLTAPVESNVVTTTIIYDWGDLPDSPYSTTLSSDGPRHVISPTLYLGALVDAETNGQPNSTATGDDTGFSDDEDGVVWQPLVLGRESIFTVTASADNGHLNGWVDFNADGDFDEPGEYIIGGALLSAGVNTFTVMVPTTATITSLVYMRFRYSTQPDLSPSGAAPDGEVEDYVTTAIAYDWGDLPDGPYPTTLAQNVPRHVISDTFYLGSRVDAEGDGQPNVGADGDDNTNTSGVGTGLPGDDEDGVEWQPLVLGRTSIFTVTASASNGYLNGWIDFNADGDLDDAGEHVFSGTLLSTGANTFTVPVPTTTTITSTTYMRFRYSTEPTLQPTGAAPDGEVEDYVAPLTAYDLGDLPEGPYPTTLAQSGPIHVITPTNNPTLGDTVDAEGDGQPSASADGDDNTLAPDDEDGVRLDSMLIAGEVTTLTITATNTSANLSAWIDFDGDGALEQIFTNTTLNVGANVLTFTVPTVVLSDTLNARFRYSTDSGLTPTGPASDGEVEDHQFEPTRLDWGDLPQPYPTRIISDGARHVILDADNPTLGTIVDAELDGQPSINADGDDNNGDDEDGVTFSGPALIPGEVITITVSATDTTGLLNAWLDLDGNGSLTDSGEQIALNVTINAGGSVQLVVPVPVTATQGITTYARFRFSTQSDLAPTGLASDGEIEDYAIPIRELEYGDLPDGPYPTLRDSDGARHIFDGVTLLGSLIDTDADGQPSINADGDDDDLDGDDEDGVTFITPLMQGQPAHIRVEAGSNGYLNAWIDFDGDGALDTVNVTAIDGLPVISTMNDISMTTGVHTFTISVPDAPISSSVYSRFRFTSYDTNGALSYTGLAADGEVEDYVLMSLGNFVWHDNGSGSGARNDGALNGSESSIPGVELELYRYDDLMTPIAATTTDAGGYYMFTGLTPYTYVVRIPASEFGSGEPLEGLLSSTGSGTDNGWDQDQDENGIDAAPTINGISSVSITLALGAEPTSEDGDANSDLTVDFGFYGGRIGDYVWLELVRDGEQGTLFENPIPGVVVDLYDSDTGAHLASDTTDGAGLYLFDDLPLNVTYTVQLSQVNFAPGGPLYPYTPTIFMVGPPATPITDSDGSPNAIFNGFGYAVTTTLTSVISEDLTLDFGFHAEPALELVKTVAPGAAARSMPFTYSIRIENTGQVTFTAMRLTDTLPSADFHYIGGTGDPADADIVAEPLLVWNDLVPVAGVLPPGGSLTVSFAVTATPGITGTFWNTATVRVETTLGDVLTDTDNVPVDIRDPAVTINKEILGIDRDGVAPDYVTFTIAITNVGPSLIDVLPMVDQYDPYYLSFHDATPYPEQDADDGILTWNDLTGPAPNGFDRNLAPGDTFHIITVFNIAHEINVTTTNVVTVADVIDLYDNPANEDEDEKDIGGQEDDDDVPTAIEVLYFRAVGEEASVRLEWATAAELALDGFSIYRAPSASFGDAQTIAYLPATGPGSEYSHIDRDVEEGQVYWYWLVEVSASDPDTYGPAQGGAGIDSLPYHLYLPLIQKELGEQSATPSPHWADWLLGHWAPLWAGLLPESRRM